jgi:hypothetical protein
MMQNSQPIHTNSLDIPSGSCYNFKQASKQASKQGYTYGLTDILDTRNTEPYAAP